MLKVVFILYNRYYNQTTCSINTCLFVWMLWWRYSGFAQSRIRASLHTKECNSGGSSVSLTGQTASVCGRVAGLPSVYRAVIRRTTKGRCGLEIGIAEDEIRWFSRSGSMGEWFEPRWPSETNSGGRERKTKTPAVFSVQFLFRTILTHIPSLLSQAYLEKQKKARGRRAKPANWVLCR